jgi:hypothetical protein
VLQSWLSLVAAVLRPERPRLEPCLRERERHLAARRAFGERRARAIADCEAGIERARARAFEADDGVVPSRMTDLEREWRMLSRPDPDAGLMDLWARVAPPSWIDRKRWRDSDPEARLDAAVALAADAAGVERAEGAIGSLRAALATWGTGTGARIRWRPFERDSGPVAALLAEPLRAAREALSGRGLERVAVERAQQLEREVHAAASARFPERDQLATELGRAAFVDFLWAGASLGAHANPVAPLRELWKTGYVLSSIDSSGAILELPPI